MNTELESFRKVYSRITEQAKRYFDARHGGNYHVNSLRVDFDSVTCSASPSNSGMTVWKSFDIEKLLSDDSYAENLGKDEKAEELKKSPRLHELRANPIVAEYLEEVEKDNKKRWFPSSLGTPFSIDPSYPIYFT